MTTVHEPLTNALIAAAIIDEESYAQARLDAHLIEVSGLHPSEYDGGSDYLVGYWLYWAGAELPDGAPRGMFQGWDEAEDDHQRDGGERGTIVE